MNRRELKSKWHGIIRNRLREYRKECLDCLYGKNGYAWDDEKRTLVLLNNILKNIPVEAWPVRNDDGSDDYKQYRIASNNWSIDLFFESNTKSRRHANLKFKRDDHTAWVAEHYKETGVFVDFDIGGS